MKKQLLQEIGSRLNSDTDFTKDKSNKSNEADVISIYKETEKPVFKFSFRSKQNWGNGKHFSQNMIQMTQLKKFYHLFYLNFTKIKLYQH